MAKSYFKYAVADASSNKKISLHNSSIVAQEKARVTANKLGIVTKVLVSPYGHGPWTNAYHGHTWKPSISNPSSPKPKGKWFKALAARVLPNGAVQVRIPRGARAAVAGRHRNPVQPGESKTWYRKGYSAARGRRYSNMDDAWHWVKGKPTIYGKRVTARESFIRGFQDAEEQTIGGY